MRRLRELNAYRDRTWERQAYGAEGDDSCGCFRLKSPMDGVDLRIIVSTGEGWDHISVSRTNRCPNWTEMEHVKRTFFKQDEIAVQYHVAEHNHVSVHNYCLHLWRPNEMEMPLPPKWMVG